MAWSELSAAVAWEESGGNTLRYVALLAERQVIATSHPWPDPKCLGLPLPVRAGRAPGAEHRLRP